MTHRNTKHPDIIKKCFVHGKCDFTDLECWFSHGDQNSTAETGFAYKCSFCDKGYSNMEQLLTHRKKSHNKTKQFKCGDFKKGACQFSSEECWYDHEDIPTEEKIEDIQNSGFQKLWKK